LLPDWDTSGGQSEESGGFRQNKQAISETHKKKPLCDTSKIYGFSA
jgi:hypothetical protein